MKNPQRIIHNIAFYTLLVTVTISLIGLSAIVYASAIGHAKWYVESPVCTGTPVTGGNWINYIPLSIYGVADYRAELNTDIVTKPTVLGGNVPNLAAGWQRGSSKLFTQGLTVWYFDSGLFVVSVTTKWMDFKTMSDYPLTLVQKVEDVSGWHVPHTPGEASIDYIVCGGGPESIEPTP